MPATLRDVADRANVSVRTVSNVVSGYEHVSEKMRSRVLAAIAELDYRPNLVARTLRTGRTGVLALIVPEIDVPYFSELARDVINAAAEVGYRVMIDQTGHDHERERQLLTGDDRTMLFDGILFSPLVTRDELREMNTTTSMPLVLLGEHEFDGHYDHVAIDNVRAARDATAAPMLGPTLSKRTTLTSPPLSVRISFKIASRVSFVRNEERISNVPFSVVCT